MITPPEHMSSSPVLSGVRVARYLVFYVMFCRSLFVLLSCFLLVIVLSVFDLRILITPLGSSNSFYDPVLKRNPGERSNQKC